VVGVWSGVDDQGDPVVRHPVNHTRLGRRLVLLLHVHNLKVVHSLKVGTHSPPSEDVRPLLLPTPTSLRPNERPLPVDPSPLLVLEGLLLAGEEAGPPRDLAGARKNPLVLVAVVVVVVGDWESV